MLAPNSPVYGNLANATGRALAGLQRSVGRTLRASNAVESMRDSGNGGQFSYATRMESDTRKKNETLRGIQNAVTYVQTQAAGLLHAQQLYERMSSLASRASNPMISHSERQSLSNEFDTLKQASLEMNNDTFQGKYLYDDIAAFVKKDVDFGGDFTDKTPKSGVNPATDRDYWEIEKDVLFNCGKFVLEMNGGATGEQYILKQGNNILFDTGWKWNTEGRAYTYDFDRFEIDYWPGKPTTFEFVPLTPGDGTDVAGNNIIGDGIGDSIPVDNGVYDNKNKYISQLGLGNSDGDESKPWNSGADYTGHKFSGTAGQVTTNPATGQSTKLSMYVEATTIFQINATYSVPSIPSNYITVESFENSSIALEPIGLGLLQDMSIATADDAADAVNSVSDEIEGIAAQMAKLGANLSQLEVAADRMSGHVSAGQAGLSRMTEGTFAEESLNFAKEQMRSESRLALMTQARRLRENLFGVLLR